jgi:chromosome segregation ATPase
MAVDGQMPGFLGAATDKRNGRMPEDWMDGGVLSNAVVGPNAAVIGFADGVVKVCEYMSLIDARNNTSRADSLLRQVSFQLSDKVALTSLCFSGDKKFLFAGTAEGSIRVYAWPFMEDDPPYLEQQAHSAAVIDIRELPTGNGIISTAEDATVFVTVTLKGDMMSYGGMDVASMYSGGDVPYNSDLILATREDMEDHVLEIQNLNKKLTEAVAKTEFAKHNLEAGHAEEMRKLVEANLMAINHEKDRFENMQHTMDHKITEMTEQLKELTQSHVKTTAEIENRYEHKLADQFERYDRLAEEMEALKQRCEGLLAAERAEFDRQITDLRNDTRQRDKKLKNDIKRMRDERSNDENAFKEILDQQEDEYEGELKQLIAAAEAELRSEREKISKLQNAVETKKTKMAQIDKKLKEVEANYKSGLVTLQNEKKEKQKLVETVAHYKKNLQEREEALAEKEKIILELRSNTRTLENFRVVLDHRLQQLSSERGPITEHIVGLENHIRSMYEELVEEFEAKKAGVMDSERKDMKLVASQHEITRLRGDNRQKEVYIAAFKR